MSVVGGVLVAWAALNALVCAVILLRRDRPAVRKSARSALPGNRAPGQVQVYRDSCKERAGRRTPCKCCAAVR
jgi:hypothetical protein